MRRWSQEAEETLWGCLEATDWDALCEPHGGDINAVTVLLNNYYVDNIIPTRTVSFFPINKPWIISDLKELFNKKKKSPQGGRLGIVDVSTKTTESQD